MTHHDAPVAYVTVFSVELLVDDAKTVPIGIQNPHITMVVLAR